MSAINEILSEGTQAFVVSGVSGEPSLQRLTFRPPAVPAGVAITQIRPTIEAALPTGTIIELWVLKFGGDPDDDDDYIYNSNVISGAALSGFGSPYARAAQLRAKSGSVGGTVIVHAVAI